MNAKVLSGLKLEAKRRVSARTMLVYKLDLFLCFEFSSLCWVGGTRRIAVRLGGWREKGRKM